jgi:hypothetical protein
VLVVRSSLCCRVDDQCASIAVGWYLPNLRRAAGGPELVRYQQLIGLGKLVTQQTIETIFQMESTRARWPLLSHASVLDRAWPSAPD